MGGEAGQEPTQAVAVIGADDAAAAVRGRLPTGDGGVILVAPDSANAVILVQPTASHWTAALATERPVVLVTDEPLDADSMLGAVIRGADAVLDGSSGGAELLAAIRTVVNGGAVLSAASTRRLAEALRGAAGDGQPLTLTRRERDILFSIERGDSVKDTAAALAISAKTVENLQTRMFRKLGVRNRAQALGLAKALGLLEENRNSAGRAGGADTT